MCIKILNKYFKKSFKKRCVLIGNRIKYVAFWSLKWYDKIRKIYFQHRKMYR